MENQQELYQRLVNKPVAACCWDGCRVVGTCVSVDGYLNVVLTQAKFFGGEASEPTALASCFVKGGSIRHIELARE